MSKAATRRNLELKRDICIKRIDECLSAAVEAQEDKSRLPIFLSRYSRLESYCASFESHHFKICSEITEVSALDTEDVIRQEVDNKYFKILEIHSNITSTSDLNSTNFTSSSDLSVKLPRLNLLHFNGDITTWGTFFDMYNTMVHQNKKLSNIERFSILISLLSGEPLQLLKGFPLSENNYLDAYAALIDRYQCKRKLAFRHWDELQKISLKSNSPRELRRLVDTFKENIAVLRNLKLPVKDWDFPLFYLLINKLDTDTRRRFELQNEDKDIPSFDSLLEYLNKAGQALELAEPETSASRARPVTAATAQFARAAPRAPAAEPSYHRSRTYAPAAAPPNNTKSLLVNSQSQSVDLCPLCKSNHSLSNCPTYRNYFPNDRFVVVKENNLCINCLNKGHAIKSCPSKGRCLKCNLAHHTTLHFDSNSRNPNYNNGVANNTNGAPSSHRVVSPNRRVVSDNRGISPNRRVVSSHNFVDLHNRVVSPNRRIASHNSDFVSSHNRVVSPNRRIASHNSNFVSSNNLVVSEGNAPSSLVSPSSPKEHSTVTLVAGSDPATPISLLATALVEVVDGFGAPRRIRVVIDSGSQSNFITQRCANRLGLVLKKTTTSVEGICQSSSLATNATEFRMRCGDHSPDIIVPSLVVPKICSQMPADRIDIAQLTHSPTIKLADPHFNVPAQIDALVGVDVFCKIFLGERVNYGPDGPVAFKTKLGWVVMGTVSRAPSLPTSLLLCTFDSLDLQIRKFWEIDEIPNSSPLSEEEARCEHIFATTHARNVDGRYVVRLPFKSPEPTFGDSHTLAYRRLLSLEKRLARNPQLREEYNDFMRDYLNAGHMQPVEQPRTERTYYIPHHCVVNPSSTTTKLRVVFDATAKPANGASLNEQLLIGPKLQSDITSILLRFRLHAFVFTADIRQMYRQILIAVPDRNYQRILFRFSPGDPVQEFRLNTVTYGMSPSSFLALRTILQVARDEGDNCPLAVAALSNDIYVDDVVTGMDSLDSTRELMRQISHVLHKGCFELRKWSSNCQSLLEDIPLEHCYDKSLSFDSESCASIKVLGLEWNPVKDGFSFTVRSLQQQCTKRNILSELARIFDPLGFLTPITFAFKCIIQTLWSQGLDWDEVAPDQIVQSWSRYRSELSCLSSIVVPRFIPAPSSIDLELHGFCDASEAGYAAVIYFRIRHSDNRVTSHFVIARSKVAPVRKISIPRLELCAAVLLADLVAHVQRIFADKLRFNNIYCWSDSSVTLAWLKSPSSRWKTYVGNRVSRIQEKVPPRHWHHVRSQCNPADCASRGLTVRELVDHPLWWAGPSWLLDEPTNYPLASDPIEKSSDVVVEQRATTVTLFVAPTKFDEFLDRYSSLNKIQRIVAYIRRFLHNCRYPENRRSGHLVAFELKSSLHSLVKIAQHSEFSKEIQILESGKGGPLPKPLQKLRPFIDLDGLVRVGGRLSYSDLDYDCKHPLLLPRQNRLTSLIINQAHTDNLHPGLRTLSFLLAQNFWILSSRRAIRHELSKCIKCYRTNPRPVAPRMADLPKLRVSQIKPFSCAGIDFAGPFPTYVLRHRGARTFKTYICLFICFATKAVHIEVVIGLTTDAFLGALRRFIARRGRCSRIHCDQGTNFVGAHNVLVPLVKSAAAAEAIEFSFNPPAASHFGGLWEANIKSFKTHLSRVVGNQILTYEEFMTVAAQIEAVLNSRPLCESSSDPNDLSVLTPGHFLTLEPLTSLPESDVSNTKLTCLNRWQLVQRLHHDFWKRWHVEYLHTLSQRAKWHCDVTEPKLGAVVIIKDEQLKPLNWSLGRIVELHRGKDGVPRVATVKTQTGFLKRPLAKLCPLPIVE